MKKYKILIKFAKGNLLFFGISFLMYLIFFVMSSFSPFLTRYLIDNAFSSNDSGKLFSFILISILVLFTLCISGVLSNYFITRASNNVNKKIKSALIIKIQNYNEHFFLLNKSGDINYRLLNDVDSIVGFFNITFISAPIDLIMLVALGIILVKWNLMLSVIVYGLLLIQLFVVTRIRTKVIKYYKLQKEKYQDLSGFVIEFFRSINLIKGINMQQKLTRNANDKLDDLEKLNIRTSVITNAMSSTSILINNSWVFLILWIGGIAVIENRMTIGTLMAFLMITGMLYPRIESLVTSFIKLQDIKTSLNRVLEYYNYDESATREVNNTNLNIKEGRISIKNLSYGYQDKLVIKDLTFHIEPKSVTVIVGRNGSGKTTICKLIAKFFKPTNGNIFIDEQDIDDMDVVKIRENVIYQPQDQYLLSGSILDNIICGDEQIDLEQINKAIKKAKIADFIQTLPNGLNTYIGEITSSVSGGQAQRIALARLYYKKPKIIILDEPTAFIDMAGRSLFNDLINDLKQSSTIVIVTHDNDIISYADHTINLDDKALEVQVKIEQDIAL